MDYTVIAQKGEGGKPVEGTFEAVKRDERRIGARGWWGGSSVMSEAAAQREAERRNGGQSRSLSALRKCACQSGGCEAGHYRAAGSPGGVRGGCARRFARCGRPRCRAEFSRSRGLEGRRSAASRHRTRHQSRRSANLLRGDHSQAARVVAPGEAARSVAVVVIPQITTDIAAVVRWAAMPAVAAVAMGFYDGGRERRERGEGDKCDEQGQAGKQWALGQDFFGYDRR
jgi:hypothetical protein